MTIYQSLGIIAARVQVKLSLSSSSLRVELMMRTEQVEFFAHF